MISYHSVFNVIIEHLLNYYEKAFYYIAPGFGLFMCSYGRSFSVRNGIFEDKARR